MFGLGEEMVALNINLHFVVFPLQLFCKNTKNLKMLLAVNNNDDLKIYKCN